MSGSSSSGTRFGQGRPCDDGHESCDEDVEDVAPEDVVSDTANRMSVLIGCFLAQKVVEERKRKPLHVQDRIEL